LAETNYKYVENASTLNAQVQDSPGILNLGSVNPLGVHECVSGVRQTKIESRKSARFHVSIVPIWAIIQFNYTTTVVWHSHVASRLTFFIWFWWRNWRHAGRCLKIASCRCGRGAHC